MNIENIKYERKMKEIILKELTVEFQWRNVAQLPCICS